MDDLDTILEYLAVELLGWEQVKVSGYTVPPDPAVQWKTPTGVLTWGSGAFDYLLTGNGMLEVLEAMRNQAFHLSFTDEIQKEYSAYFVHYGNPDEYESEVVYNESLPHAVAEAAYQALRGEGQS